MATLSMRAPSMLPSIKCSNCGDHIEISRMGDHICRPQDYASDSMQERDLGHHAFAPRASIPSRHDSTSIYDSPQESQVQFSKATPYPPPRIDVSAAQNYSRGDAHPASARSPRYFSPVVPPSDVRSAGGTGRPQAYQSRSVRPERNASVDRAPNLDSAFPRFPASSTTPPPTSPWQASAASREPYRHTRPDERRTPSPVERVQDQGREGAYTRPITPHDRLDRDEAKRDDFFSNKPSRAKSRVDSATRQRMQSTEYAPSIPPSVRQPSPPLQHSRRPSYPQSGQHSPAESIHSTTSQRTAPSRPERPGGEVDRFIARLKEDSAKPARIGPDGARTAMRPGLRAEMPSYRFPRKDSISHLERSSSEPLNHNDYRPDFERSSTTHDLRRLPSTSTSSSSGSISLPYQAGHGSLSGLHITATAADRDSYTHGPSPSDSSTASTANSGRTGRSTPMSDISSPETRSPPQLCYRTRGTVYNPYEESTNEPVPRQQHAWAPQAKTYASNTHLSPVSPFAPSPKLESVQENPYAPAPRLAPVLENPYAPSPVKSVAESSSTLVSRQTPDESAFASSTSQYQYQQHEHQNHTQQQPQYQRSVPWGLNRIDEAGSSPIDDEDDSRNSSPMEPSSYHHHNSQRQHDRHNDYFDSTTPSTKHDHNGLDRSITEASLASTSSISTQRSGPPKPRHNCRGCTQPIIGKSIRAADGRLTGRYHKSCFVCTTCASPFSSTHFYVHEDRPYCEQHYHAVNGSLCRGCDTGIEGQYAETEDKAKWHPRCLCCSTCRLVLDGDYFDVGGRVFCERHAVAEVRRLGDAGNNHNNGHPQRSQGAGNGLLSPDMAQGQFGGNGGGWKAERRRTKLGMMQPSWIGI